MGERRGEEFAVEITEREKRVARALEMHAVGYNCAQCVACACADAVGLDAEQAFRLVKGGE